MLIGMGADAQLDKLLVVGATSRVLSPPLGFFTFIIPEREKVLLLGMLPFQYNYHSLYIIANDLKSMPQVKEETLTNQATELNPLAAFTTQGAKRALYDASLPTQHRDAMSLVFASK